MENNAGSSLVTNGLDCPEFNKERNESLFRAIMMVFPLKKSRPEADELPPVTDAELSLTAEALETNPDPADAPALLVEEDEESIWLPINEASLAVFSMPAFKSVLSKPKLDDKSALTLAEASLLLDVFEIISKPPDELLLPELDNAFN